jgi:membrane protease YdiL (CAAX protease family)
MSRFFLFVGLLGVALVLAAALTYPAWLLVGLVSVEPVHRVMHRVAMLLALIGLVVLTRKLGLADRDSLGYGIPRRRFLAQLLTGLLCGFALMAPLTTLLLGLDIRDLRPDVDASVFARTLAAGLASGLVVAFIEETFFRGVLFSAVARSANVKAAVIAPSLLYAALHFLGGRLRVPAEEVGWGHGFAVLAKLFERYAEPLTFIDSLLALFMLGVLLALVRMRTGAIAACIGLHAAGVCVIAVLRATTVVNPADEQAALVGSYDGVIGWAALLWFGAIAIAYRLRGKFEASSNGARPTV